MTGNAYLLFQRLIVPEPKPHWESKLGRKISLGEHRRTKLCQNVTYSVSTVNSAVPRQVVWAQGKTGNVFKRLARITPPLRELTHLACRVSLNKGRLHSQRTAQGGRDNSLAGRCAILPR